MSPYLMKLFLAQREKVFGKKYEKQDLYRRENYAATFFGISALRRLLPSLLEKESNKREE